MKAIAPSTFLFGQSIPASCRGLSLKLLVDGLKHINSVTIRDQESYRLLTGLGVDCTLSYDTAFVLKCSDEALHCASNILNSMDARYSAVISLREFNALYPVDNQQFVENIASLSHQLWTRKYQPVLLIQSSVSEMDSDWVIAKAIQERCPEVKVLDLVNYVSAFPSWELLQAILQVSRIIVAVRYHTAVLALAADRTPYNLYYSNKGADLSNRLDIPGGHIKHFCPSEEVDLIVQSGLVPFDAQSVRNRVQNDFKRALDNVGFQQSLLSQHYETA
ncbi:MAG: polysaccharide pyruvyl transferase family protein [Methylococcaceae bacterium]|nr:polysaccharide pyruvyl transferase family protein [Methylococcaceae bacterium]